MIPSFRGSTPAPSGDAIPQDESAEGDPLRHLTDRERKSAANHLQSIREAIGDDVPVYGSLIGFEIFLLLCERHLTGTPVRLKDIYVELDRSHGGVRRLVRDLEADGWIQLRNSGEDRRALFVAATPKLVKAFESFVTATVP